MTGRESRRFSAFDRPSGDRFDDCVLHKARRPYHTEVKPQHTLGLITTPDGSEFVLHERDGAYSIRVNGRELMTSRAHGSEEALARLILSRFEHELTARNAAIDVVCGSREKQARMSGHGISPMRGRDNHLLLSHSHNSSIRYVAPMQVWSFRAEGGWPWPTFWLWRDMTGILT
jgi:hypothetical protein